MPQTFAQHCILIACSRNKALKHFKSTTKPLDGGCKVQCSVRTTVHQKKQLPLALSAVSFYDTWCLGVCCSPSPHIAHMDQDRDSISTCPSISDYEPLSWICIEIFDVNTNNHILFKQTKKPNTFSMIFCFLPSANQALGMLSKMDCIQMLSYGLLEACQSIFL